MLDPAKFSLVGMTVAGFGESTPPARDFTNFYQQDAEDGVELMKILGFPKSWHKFRQDRVAKCHRYGRYICVKILESWGKKCRRPRSFVK